MIKKSIASAAIKENDVESSFSITSKSLKKADASDSDNSNDYYGIEEIKNDFQVL